MGHLSFDKTSGLTRKRSKSSIHWALLGIIWWNCHSTLYLKNNVIYYWFKSMTLKITDWPVKASWCEANISAVISNPMKSFNAGYSWDPPAEAVILLGGWTAYGSGAEGGLKAWTCAWEMSKNKLDNSPYRWAINIGFPTHSDIEQTFERKDIYFDHFRSLHVF